MNGSAARKEIIVGLALVFFALTGCAGRQPHTVAAPSPGNVVSMEASSFKFDPNRIELRKEGTLTLQVQNTSGTEHNITIKNPHGEVLKSVDLPPHETVSVDVYLPEPGTYEFYCDKPFHSTLGMKGSIVVPGGDRK